MNKAYSHNDHNWGITITIKRRYHVKHLYYRSDRTCFNFFFFVSHLKSTHFALILFCHHVSFQDEECDGWTDTELCIWISAC
jgi:hypothetical protein